MLLALDTSTDVGSVAVGRGDRLLVEVTLGVRVRGRDALLPAIDCALATAQLAPADLAGVVVAGGPGSFTGVRIAGATAKAFARARGIPLYAYSGLLALAAGVAAGARPVCALFDARRGEVYAACYAFAGNGSTAVDVDVDVDARRRASSPSPSPSLISTLLEPVVCPLADVLNRLKPHDPLYVGEGALRYAHEITGDVAPARVGIPRAAALLWLAAVAPDAGRVADVASWEPRYLRAPGAERGVVG